MVCTRVVEDVSFIEGWIKDFFLYDKNEKFILNDESITFEQIPSSFVSVPVRYVLEDDNGKEAVD
jgi:hypothetical protein